MRVSPVDNLSQVSRPGPGGARIACYVVRCQGHGCREILDVPRRAMKGGSRDNSQELQFVERTLTAAGWIFKARLRRVRCPACHGLSKQKGAEPVPSQTTVKPAAPKLVPPKTLDRDHRRRIHECLDGTYDTEAGRYLDDYSDAVVAKELNVPRAWVAEVRELMFGSEDLSEHKVKALSDAAALQKEIDTLKAQFADAVRKLETKLKTITEGVRRA